MSSIMKRFGVLAIMLLFIQLRSLAQCPTLEQYSQGNGGPTNCAGVNSNPIASNFTGTKYATIPTSAKTGNFTAVWSGAAPSPIPAIANFYQGVTVLADTAGPAAPNSGTGSTYKYKYCFYGATNLPNSGNYTVYFVDPSNDTTMYACTYTGSNNSVTSVAQPTITSQPTSQVGCIGYRSQFTMTASPATGGNTLTYQWYKSGVAMSNTSNITGVTTNTLTINAVTASDTGTKIYYCVVTETVADALQITKSVSLTLNNQAQFNGTTSNAWNTASNWSTGTVPDSTVHAYVPSTATNMPQVTATSSCKCVTIESGATLTVNGGTLQIAGRINNSGTFTSTAGSIKLYGTTVAQNIPASTFSSNTIQDLAINNTVGVSLSGTLNVTGIYTPTAGTFTTGGYLTLKSTSSGTARVAAGSTSGGYISGNVTTERYIPAHTYRSWRLLAPMTSGTQTIKSAWQEGGSGMSSNPNPGYGTYITCNSSYTTSAGFDSVMPLPSIQTFDMASQTWTANPITNTNVKQLSSENGYFLYTRGDRTIPPSSSYTGSTATTLRSTGTVRQGDQSSISISASKFQLIGNPFPSPIDFSAIASGDRTNLSNRFWLWDPQLPGSVNLGAYVLFDASTSTPWTPSNSSGSYSSPNSVIPSGMAFFVQCGGTAGSLILRESIKTTGSSNNGFKTTNNGTEEMHITLAYIRPDTTVANADGFFSIFNGTAAAAVDADDAGKPTNFGENMGIYRENKTLALEARPTLAENTNDSVFMRLWKTKQLHYQFTLMPTNFRDNMSAKLYDKYTGDSMVVDMKNISTYDFDINGDTLSQSQYRFFMVYHADSIIAPTSVTGMSNKSDNVVVYPNPSHNGQVTVKINGAAKGMYTFELYNMMGQKMHAEAATHTSGTLIKNIQPNVTLPAGNYNLSIRKNNTHFKTIQIEIK